LLRSDRRLRRADDFRAVLRGGARAGSATLVVHVAVIDGPERPARAGFVVGRSVGGSVVRHRVLRRLRHLMAQVLDEMPPGWALVVRAMPPSASASAADLRADLGRCLRRARARVELPAGAVSR
jgi:ribonuclease P protein component